MFQKSHHEVTHLDASREDVTQQNAMYFFRRAGYQGLTPLQERVIPLVLSGSDLLIETAGAKGRTAAFLVPLLISRRTDEKREVRSLILASSRAEVEKIERQYKRFRNAVRGIPPLAAFGYESDVRKEFQQLERTPDIIVGTPERIIDHIRRGNLSLSTVTRLVVTVAEGEFEPGIGKDILYIFSKLGKHVQSMFFVPDSSIVSGLLQEMPIRPQTVNRTDWDRRNISRSYYLIPKGTRKADAVSEIVTASFLSDCAVLTKTQAEADEVCKELLASGISSRVLSQTEHVQPEYSQVEQVSGEKLPSTRVRCIPLQGCTGIGTFRNVILYQVPASCEQYDTLVLADSAQSLSSGPLSGASGEAPRLIVLVSDDEVEQLQHLQEISAGIMKKENYPKKDAILGGKIEAMIKKIREEEDPDELNQYRKIIRKHVPLHLRSYFAAYLLKSMKNGGNGGTYEKDVQTLFVSIGKNRKVYPKDLIGLFCSTLGIESQSLGNVKVLDNYSFIDIPTPYAQKAIDELDGKDYRGRKLTVNFARKREEKEQA